MSRMDRRRFLFTSAAAAASLKSLAQSPISHGPSASSPAPQLARPPKPEGITRQSATLTLHTDQSGPTIPTNFVGLSYETQQLSEPDFFSPDNHGLIQQFRELAPRGGVLRLGGNTSDYGFWKPTPSSTPPPRAPRPYKVGDPPPDLIYNVTPEAVRNLNGFLSLTGWSCLYGINLGTSTPQIAADEAEFVSKTLGAKLQYFQVGNEADRFGSTIRDPKTWNANTYFDNWLAFANAIRARVPTAKFGLPDTAGNPAWYAAVVDRLLALPADGRPDVAALTHHYYFTGPPSNPKATIDNLLQADPNVDKLASDITAAAKRLGDGEHRTVAYRMTEGNTCYRGGKPGFSDVFAASLWAADYLLRLASLGYAGVNLHGGQRKFVAQSLGGTLPGEALLTNPSEPHPRPFYTPIADVDGHFVAEPVSYGMRFAQRFAGATIIPHDFDPGPANATAYAAHLPLHAGGAGYLTPGQTIVAIINKDPTRDLDVVIEGNWLISETLGAPSLTSTTVGLSPADTRKRIVPAASAAIFSPVTVQR